MKSYSFTKSGPGRRAVPLNLVTKLRATVADRERMVEGLRRQISEDAIEINRLRSSWWERTVRFFNRRRTAP